MDSIPNGVVRIVPRDDPQNWSKDNLLPIYDIGALYRVIGANSDNFGEWQSFYGMDSLGRGPNGETFIPDFPEFSKVAWMDIDPVMLSEYDLDSLITECQNAELRASTADERAIFVQIAKFADRAKKLGASLEFGHP